MTVALLHVRHTTTNFVLNGGDEGIVAFLLPGIHTAIWPFYMQSNDGLSPVSAVFTSITADLSPHSKGSNCRSVRTVRTNGHPRRRLIKTAECNDVNINNLRPVILVALDALSSRNPENVGLLIIRSLRNKGSFITDCVYEHYMDIIVRASLARENGAGDCWGQEVHILQVNV